MMVTVVTSLTRLNIAQCQYCFGVCGTMRSAFFHFKNAANSYWPLSLHGNASAQWSYNIVSVEAPQPYTNPPATRQKVCNYQITYFSYFRIYYTRLHLDLLFGCILKLPPQFSLFFVCNILQRCLPLSHPFSFRLQLLKPPGNCGFHLIAGNS